MGSKILLIGGAGFVGLSLISRISKNFEIYVFDCVPCNKLLEGHDIHGYFVGDITIESSIASCINSVNPDIIVCLASWGMSGADMLSRRCYNINVNGIQNIINSMKEANITRLVYTSTYNVVFGGKAIVNGDESMSYFPCHQHTDEYSKTKTIADETILNANNSKTRNGSILHTSILRPAAIYGEEERRHFPRIVRLMDLGLFSFLIGNAVVDWLYIDNLNDAFIKLIDKMLSNETTVSGNAYFISDGTPILNFEFFRPLTEARGAPYPSLVIPKNVMLSIARIFEIGYRILGIPPFLTQAEVLKVGETHYFSIAKAQRDFNYQPKITSTEGAKLMAAHYRKNISNENFFRVSEPFWWAAIATGMSLLGVFAFNQTDFSVLSRKNSAFIAFGSLQKFSYFVFRSQKNLRIVFWTAVVVHLAEAGYAVKVAIDLKCKNTWPLWGLQTLLLGFASLKHLISRKAWLIQETFVDKKIS